MPPEHKMSETHILKDAFKTYVEFTLHLKTAKLIFLAWLAFSGKANLYRKHFDRRQKDSRKLISFLLLYSSRDTWPYINTFTKTHPIF